VTGALSLGVKRPASEADHSSPSTAEVKNAWSYISTPKYVFMVWCLVTHRDDNDDDDNNNKLQTSFMEPVIFERYEPKLNLLDNF
jgi:hypothetical protein